MTSATNDKPTILITGGSGLIGSTLIRSLLADFSVASLDLEPPESGLVDADFVRCDLTDDESVRDALDRVRHEHGTRLASVIHLAAYYDFSGEPSSLYRELTVEGTQRLIRGLQDFDVQQFVFSSSLLVMQSAEEGRLLSESSTLEAEWDYPRSKLAAEAVIRNERGEIPTVVLRIAGVYDERCHSIPIAQHIRRIYEKELESYFFPGDKSHGQSFIHLEDLVEGIRKTIDRRAELEPYEVLLVGEEDVMSYADLQEKLGELIHGQQWPTIRIPKSVAKAGAWVKEKLATSEEDAPFIKPWMVDLADQNYPIQITRAWKLLNWQPRHTLRETLPQMVRHLKQDPRGWYAEHDLPIPENVEAIRS